MLDYHPDSKDFEEEWGFSPDYDYELVKQNKTPEEAEGILEKSIKQLKGVYKEIK